MILFSLKIIFLNFIFIKIFIFFLLKIFFFFFKFCHSFKEQVAFDDFECVYSDLPAGLRYKTDNNGRIKRDETISQEIRAEKRETVLSSRNERKRTDNGNCGLKTGNGPLTTSGTELLLRCCRRCVLLFW